MISLELTEELKQSRTNMHNLARDLFRPIARKYDIEEHTYPKELDILRPPKPKKDSSEAEKKPVEVKEVKKDKKPAGPKDDNLIGVLSVEELCWGDLGLMLTFPGMGLGNAAISAVGTPEQKIKFGSRWAAMAITEPEAGSDSAAVQTTAVSMSLT